MQSSRMVPTGSTAIGSLTTATEKRTRWRLFLLGFTLTALAGLCFTWLRPPLYESTALLRIDDRPAGGAEVPEAFVLEQLVIHRQRLRGRQLLDEVAGGLQSLGIGPVRLREMLSARILDDSRLLELSARGPDPALLAPALSHWIERYQKQDAGEWDGDSRAAGLALQEKLDALEDRVKEQREAVEAPHRPAIVLLGPPFVPGFPYAPDYWRDTGISFIAAPAVGLLTVGCYRVMTPRDHRPGILITGCPEELPSREPEKLVGAGMPALEHDLNAGLTARSCRVLVDTASPPAALALRLLLSGVQPQRLAGLRGSALGSGWGELAGTGGHRLLLSEPTRQLAADLVEGPDRLVWRNRRGRALGGEGIDGLLRDAAYEAGLAEAAVPDRRRVFATYLEFIARQGIDPATLVSHLGPLDADWLALYRRQLQKSDPDRAFGRPPVWRHPAAD